MKQRTKSSSPGRKTRKYQLQSAKPYHQVKLMPDKSTEKLRQMAKQYKQNVVVTDIPSDNKIVNIKTDKLASGFVRSKRNMQMMPDSGTEDKVMALQQEKADLVKQLNAELLKLDQINEEKRQFHDQLLEQLKFVRDLHAATAGGVENVSGLVSEQTKAAYKQETTIRKQLEALLQRAEVDRSSLLQRLQTLQNSKHLHVAHHQQCQDQTAAQQHYRKLTHHIGTLKAEIEQVQKETHRLKHSADDQDLLAKAQAIEVLRREGQMLLEKTEFLQQREINALQSLKHSRQRITAAQGSSAKMLGMQVLLNSLANSLNRVYYCSFQQFWLVSNQQQNEAAKLTALYLVFQQIRKRNLRDFLISWFARKNQNNICPRRANEEAKFRLLQDKIRKRANKYIAQKDEDRSQDKICRTILHVCREWETRLLYSSFAHWKHRALMLPQALMRLQSYKLRSNFETKLAAISKWRVCFQEQQMNARLLALPVKIACMQHRKRILTAWREFTQHRRVKTRSRLVRAFKNLQVYQRRQKQMKQLKILSTTMNAQVYQLVKQQCWNQIALSSEVNKLTKCESQLSSLAPTIEQLLVRNKELDRVLQKNQLVRAVTALVLTPFRKQLSQVLHKWLRNAQHKTCSFQKTMKLLLLKVYNLKLAQAFNRLKITEAYKQKQKHHQNINQQHALMQQRQTQNYRLNFVVGQEQQRINHLACRHLRSLCDAAFSKNLSYWLNRWLQGCNLKKAKSSALDFFIKKMRKIRLKQGFSQYRRGFDLLKQDINNRKRIIEVKSRIEVRTKGRIFKAIWQFAHNHMQRSKAMKYLQKTIDRHNRIRGMLSWIKFTKNTREETLLKEEANLVDDLEVIQQQVSTIQDHLNQNDLQNKRLAKILTLEAKITLSKWCERFCLGGLQYGFITWRQKADNLRHRANFVQSTLTNLGKGYLRLAWFRWQQCSHNLSSDQNQAYVARISASLIPQELLKIKFNRQCHKENSSKLKEEAILPIRQIQTLKKQREVLVESMSLRVIDCDKMSQLRFIVQTWSKHAKASRKGGKALERGIAKLMMQRGFNEIRETLRSKDLVLKKQQFANHLLRMFRCFRLRQRFTFWRCIDYNYEMAVIRNAKIETKTEIIVHTAKVTNMKAHHSVLWNNRSHKIMLQALFDAWHSWSHTKAIHKREARKLPILRSKYLCKRSLMHWHGRIQATQKVQAQISKVAAARKRIMKAAVFQSMKHLYLKAKNMAVKTYNFVSALKYFQMETAFQKVLLHSQIRYEASIKNKHQSCRFLLKTLDRVLTKNLRQAHNNLRQFMMRVLKVRALIQQYGGNNQAIKLRDSFFTWKRTQDKLDVVDLNENMDGPTNLQAWDCRIQCNSLIKMLQNDGQTDNCISTLLQAQTFQFNYLVDKTVTRMMIHTDQNLALMPYCLDKMRNHARAMKRWRSTLKFCNGLLNQDSKTSLFSRFRKWANRHQNERDHLHATQYNALVQRADWACLKMVQVADSVDMRMNALDQFEEQKGVLFSSYMQSQRLALSSVQKNQERAQLKALSKMQANSSNVLATQIQLALDRNLDTIKSLKQKITSIETENANVAASNDHYRHSAHHAQQNARVLQHLESETTQMLAKQREQAVMTKNLIEESSKLNQALHTIRAQTSLKLEETALKQHQAILELETLRDQERESYQRQQALSQSKSINLNRSQELHSIQTYHPQGLNDAPHSPPIIMSPATTPGSLRVRGSSINGKSPLRTRFMNKVQ